MKNWISRLTCPVTDGKPAIFLIFLFFIFSSKVFAGELIINEFVPKGEEEWVEIYNSTDGEINLTGWILSDKANPAKSLTSLGNISAHGLVVYPNAKGWLNDDGDILTLKNNNSDLIDQIIYGNEPGSVIDDPEEGKSVARLPNAGGWYTDIDPTRNQPNPQPPSPSPSFSPSPSEEPSPSPSPSPTSTPTPTPTVKPSPSPTKKPSPKPSPSPSPSPDEEEFTGEVFGAQDSSPVSPSASPAATGKFSLSPPLIISSVGALLLIGSGLMFSAPKIKSFLRRIKKSKSPGMTINSS